MLYEMRFQEFIVSLTNQWQRKAQLGYDFSRSFISKAITFENVTVALSRFCNRPEDPITVIGPHSGFASFGEAQFTTIIFEILAQAV